MKRLKLRNKIRQIIIETWEKKIDDKMFCYIVSHEIDKFVHNNYRRRKYNVN